ncbi:membrane protein [Arthrobacter phage Qui]|jgi:hypothetical protein|uniref:Membrane protein n=1 Tax=Arthrobacter phage Qui TaxID=2603260 RepID=A0A5B8WPE7_9CAUD|nr:membrane protein [Arthrobacter phage Qui]QED11548.1 membrane protein [Arthrobacter phage Qui]QOC56380.1 membrane protein [Arthrobacter phage Paella]
MDTIHEETLSVEENESDDEVRPLTTEEKVLLAKAIGTAAFIGAAAIYGTAVASYQAGRHLTIKILEHYSKKKEESTN